jgi:hypothetical protein
VKVGLKLDILHSHASYPQTAEAVDCASVFSAASLAVLQGGSTQASANRGECTFAKKTGSDGTRHAVLLYRRKYHALADPDKAAVAAELLAVRTSLEDLNVAIALKVATVTTATGKSLSLSGSSQTVPAPEVEVVLGSLQLQLLCTSKSSKLLVRTVVSVQDPVSGNPVDQAIQSSVSRPCSSFLSSSTMTALSMSDAVSKCFLYIDTERAVMGSSTHRAVIVATGFESSALTSGGVSVALTGGGVRVRTMLITIGTASLTYSQSPAASATVTATGYTMTPQWLTVAVSPSTALAESVNGPDGCIPGGSAWESINPNCGQKVKCADIFSATTLPYLPTYCFVGETSIVASLKAPKTLIGGKLVKRLDVSFPNPSSVDMIGAATPFGLACGESQTCFLSSSSSPSSSKWSPSSPHKISWRDINTALTAA